MAYAGPTSSNYPTSLDDLDSLFGDPADFQEFTLETGIDAAATSFVANESTSACEGPLFIRFNTGELVWAEDLDTGTDTFSNVDRGVSGTTPASHSADEVFRAVPSAYFFRQYKNAIIAIETELGTDPAGSLTDVKTRLAVALNDDGTLKIAAVTTSHVPAGHVTQHAGVTDADIVQVDDASLGVGDVAFWTASGLEGKTALETITALLEPLEDAVGDMVGGGSDQQGIAVSYDDTNGELDFILDFGIADDDVLQVDAAAGAPNSGEIARFTANGIEGRLDSEVKTQLGYMTDLTDDASPQLAGDLDGTASAYGITNLGPVDFYEEATAAGQTSVVWTTANNQKLTLTSSPTIVFTAPDGPCHLQLKITQDATGSRIITWPGTVYWPNGIEPTLSTTGTDVDLITFWYDGTNYFGSYGLDYS